MGIFQTFKTISLINKAVKFIEKNKDAVEKAKALIDKLEDGLEIITSKKDEIELNIARVKEAIKKLKEFTNK